MEQTKAPWSASSTLAKTDPPPSGLATAAPWAKTGCIPSTGISRHGGMGMLGGTSAGGMGILSRNDQSAIQVEPRMPETIEIKEPTSASPSSDENQQQPRWRPASKRITTAEDLKRFQASSSFHGFLSFVSFLNISVQGKKGSAPCESSEAIQSLRNLLTCLSKWVDE